jgi:nucleoside-diphosphate-sugar epimerase
VKVFVTGATGYVGGAVARAFRADGHEVWGSARDAGRADRLAARGIEPVVGTLEAPAAFLDRARSCDVLVHAAMGSGPDMFERDRQTVDALLEAARSGGRLPAFLYTSGCWIYGDTAGRIADETSALNPPAYAKLRPGTERRVLEARGVRGIVMRPGCLYGGSGGLTAPWFEGALRGTSEVVGDGMARWAMIHGDDVADAYVRAAESDLPGEVFDVSDGSEATQADMVRAAALAAGYSGEIRRVPVAEAVRNLGAYAECLAYDQRLSASKAARLVGWAPRHTGFIAEAGACFAAWKASASGS